LQLLITTLATSFNWISIRLSTFSSPVPRKIRRFVAMAMTVFLLHNYGPGHVGLHIYFRSSWKVFPDRDWIESTKHHSTRSEETLFNSL